MSRGTPCGGKANRDPECGWKALSVSDEADGDDREDDFVEDLRSGGDEVLGAALEVWDESLEPHSGLLGAGLASGSDVCSVSDCSLGLGMEIRYSDGSTRRDGGEKADTKGAAYGFDWVCMSTGW